MKLEIELPDSIASQAREFATRERISLDQLVATALAAQLDARPLRPGIAERAARADWQRIDEILKRVPAAPPVSGDEK